MTTEEKLKHFRTMALDEARRESTEAIEEHRRALDTLYAEHTVEKERQAAIEIKTETDRLQREDNIELSKERLAIKRELSRKHEELKNKLFVEVQEKLTDYMSSPKYQKLLISQIKNILKFADGEPVTIYIDPADQAYLTSLSAAVNHPLKLSEYSFGGGTRAVFPGRRILIDNSFDSKFEEAKKNFSFDGGVLHE